MELPTSLTDLIYLALVAILTFMPIFSVPGAWSVFQVWRNDTARPRNRVIQVMSISSATSALASVLFTILTIEFWSTTFSGTSPDADFGGLLFLIVLIAITYMPRMKWKSLEALNGGVNDLSDIPETQNQREDRQFGDQRRELEAQHNRDLTG